MAVTAIPTDDASTGAPPLVVPLSQLNALLADKGECAHRVACCLRMFARFMLADLPDSDDDVDFGVDMFLNMLADSLDISSQREWQLRERPSRPAHEYWRPCTEAEVAAYEAAQSAEEETP